MFKIKVPFTSLQKKVQSEWELLPRVAKMKDISLKGSLQLARGGGKRKKVGMKLHTHHCTRRLRRSDFLTYYPTRSRHISQYLYSQKPVREQILWRPLSSPQSGFFSSYIQLILIVSGTQNIIQWVVLWKEKKTLLNKLVVCFLAHITAVLFLLASKE